ncbi:formyltetrahydrofolate deformylase [Pseudonocardia kujensis]|uniref:formyltetrahydrofolate deformylase n=1 Tax=Pseudonocardia kujensis TaxID=1128675 RepID=UPI001E5D7A6C|nr:formyltetrahydrofolate deformylase [Pseudonocardia kujensis]MCE0762038.1 formyltetrahydrofolate deformylase [Pseudonocardia kujensis]
MNPSTTDRPTGPCVLTLSCPDVPGIVRSVSGFLFDQGHTILESQQFSDPESGTFFLRVGFAPADGGGAEVEPLRAAFADVATEYAMTWKIVSADEPTRVLVMVSREAHCLNELLFRNSVGDLNLDVAAVVSNHTDLRHVAERFEVPFHHIPVTAATKREAEAALLDLVADLGVELVVLARYMQILSDDLCKQLEGRAINIHHSMLPSFKGARPYHQAHQRGVKVIGATAHYVTSDLDEGPIIEQQIAEVNHAMSPAALVARGRGTEARALLHAVRWHTENRVLLNGGRTVVLR